MKYTILGKEKNIVYAQCDEVVIFDAQSALDFLVTVRYETDCDRVILGKNAVCEDFFILSKGIAGEIIQKFINYQMKLALIGDYSMYTSKPLHDFIYESNNGQHVFFVGTLEEATEKLERAR